MAHTLFPLTIAALELPCCRALDSKRMACRVLKREVIPSTEQTEDISG